MLAKFLIPPVSCPNCESRGELTRLLFHNPFYEGAAYVDSDLTNSTTHEFHYSYVSAAIKANMICPVCEFEADIIIALDFVEPVVKLDGLGEVVKDVTA